MSDSRLSRRRFTDSIGARRFTFKTDDRVMAGSRVLLSEPSLPIYDLGKHHPAGEKVMVDIPRWPGSIQFVRLVNGGIPTRSQRDAREGVRRVYQSAETTRLPNGDLRVVATIPIARHLTDGELEIIQHAVQMRVGKEFQDFLDQLTAEFLYGVDTPRGSSGT